MFSSVLFAVMLLATSMMSIRGFAAKNVATGVTMRSVAKRGGASRLFSVQGGATPTPEESKAFYALGVNVARQVGGELKGLLSPEELDAMLKGFSDSMLGKAGDERALLTEQGPKLNELLTARAGRVVDDEKKRGADFVTSFLLRNPRAIKTPSGLVFNEILMGIGKQATPESTVLVHYHGTLTDGTVFDSSVERKEPIKFPLKNVIRGWQEGVSMMRVGGKATMVVPSDLAYGDSGSPPVIPPGATLIFEVELLEVN